jgi:hypothetical protein
MASLVFQNLTFFYKWHKELKSRIQNGAKFEFETLELGFTVETTAKILWKYCSYIVATSVTTWVLHPGAWVTSPGCNTPSFHSSH